MSTIDFHRVDLLFVVSPGTYIGGAEKYVYDMARVFQKEPGYRVLVAVSHNHPFYLKTRSSKVPTLYLGDTLREASKHLASYMQSTSIDAVVSNGYHSLYLVFLARCRKFLYHRKKTIFADIKHGWIKTTFLERLKTFLDKILVFWCDYIIIVNSAMKKELPFLSKKTVRFLPSGTIIPKTKMLREKSSSGHHFTILLVGRLSQEKRFGLSLSALELLHHERFLVRVIGDGAESNHLKTLVREAGMGDRVIFEGYQDGVGRFYADADLLMISSLSEGCPLVALEAMAHGVLVLSTDVGYMPALLSCERGFLVSKNISPRGLARTVTAIMHCDDAKKQVIKKNALTYVAAHHDIEINAERLKRLFHHGHSL